MVSWVRQAILDSEVGRTVQTVQFIESEIEWLEGCNNKFSGIYSKPILTHLILTFLKITHDEPLHTYAQGGVD